MTPEFIIRRPIILTEKASLLNKENKVVFEVAPESNKVQIREAIEKLFNVSVTNVNTLLMRGKDRRMGRGYGKMQNWKKAVITLRAGDTIEFFDVES